MDSWSCPTSICCSVRGCVVMKGMGVDALCIPHFWQTVQCDVTRDIMNEKDIEVLKYIAEIKVSMLLGFG